MKTKNKSILSAAGILFALVLILQGCQSSLNVSKRKHRGGYYVSWVGGEEFNKEIRKDKEVRNDSKKVLFTKEKIKVKNALNLELKPLETVKEKPGVGKKGVVSELEVIPVRQGQIKNDSDYTLVIEGNKQLISVEKKSKNGTGYLGYGLLSGVVLLGSFLLKKVRHFKRLSLWASENKGWARVGVGLSSVSLFFSGVYSGIMAGESDWLLGKVGLFSGIAVLSIFSYKRKNSYISRKFKEFVFLSSLLGLFHVGGQKIASNYSSSMEESKMVQVDDKKVEDVNKDPAVVFTKILGSILLCGLALLGEALLIGFACELACAGYGAAAAIFYFGGSVLLVGLLAFALVLLWRGLKKNDKDKEKRERSFWIKAITYAVLKIGTIITFIVYD